MTSAERAALEAIARAEIPIANPAALGAAASLSLPDARSALDSLKDAGLVDWQPAVRAASGAALTYATWALTAQGREALTSDG